MAIDFHLSARNKDVKIGDYFLWSKAAGFLNLSISLYRMINRLSNTEWLAESVENGDHVIISPNPGNTNVKAVVIEALCH